MMLEAGYRWCNGLAENCAPLDVIGRLPPGRELEEARAELSAILASVDTAPGARLRTWSAGGHGRSA